MKKLSTKKDHGMSAEEIEENRKHFEEIIYDNLLKILETRTSKPVSKFAKMILEDAGLNKDGEPIEEGKVPSRVDRVKVSKGDLDDEKPEKKKDKKKKGQEDSEEEERIAMEKRAANDAKRAEKKRAKKAADGVILPPKEEAPA